MLVKRQEGGAQESGKARRREKIIKAARALIRDTGQVGLSMRSLAIAAEVSITTPYNLFGSKGGILHAIFEEDFWRIHESYQALKSKNDLSRIIQFVTLTCEIYAEEPNYHKAVMGQLLASPAQNENFGDQRLNIWKEMTLSAWNAGLIHREVDPHILADALISHYAAAMLVWTNGRITLFQMEWKIRYGFSLILLSVSNEPGRKYLSKEFRQAQKNILSVGAGLI